jgi:hypothetical protein
VSIPPYLIPKATDSARTADAGRKTPRGATRFAVLFVVIVLVSAAVGAGIDHGLANGSSSGRSETQRYRAELRALSVRSQMSKDALGTFGKQECQAARLAHSDGGSALLKFKSVHLSAVYAANDQVAIETFRTLFIVSGQLLCPDVEATIMPASRPLG